MNGQIVLAISNILLGSRALLPSELDAALNYLFSGLSPVKQVEVRQQLRIARGSYTPLSQPKLLLSRLAEVAAYIANHRRLTFTYLSSQATEPTPLIHHAQPVALFFEVHYFYVAMLSQTRGGYWLYRLDRIGEIKAVSEGDKLDYATRFSLQDHRRQTYLLDSGDLMQIQFVYRYYPQTALDQFPGSRVIRHNADGSVVIEAFARLDGALLWLLSQGAALKVISPPSLIKRMREELMAALYQYKQ